MYSTVLAQVEAVEERLRTAMLAADVAALDELLAPSLIFTNHLGQLQGKEDDLAAYRSGVLRVEKLETSEQEVRVLGDVAVVSVRVLLAGTYAGAQVNGDFRFTRVWALSEKKTWQIVVAHSGLVKK